MKITNLSWLIIVNFICPSFTAFAVSDDFNEQSREDMAIQTKIRKHSYLHDETIKLEKTGIKNFVKIANREQFLKLRSKQNLAPLTLDENKSLEIVSEFSHSRLDLSIPSKVKQVKKPRFVFNSSRKNYLPDLFRNNQRGKNKSILLEAKMLRREEDRLDKEKIVDGAGIDFKLIH